MKEKISNFALICVGTLALLILLLGFAKYVFPVLLPFVISWMIASATVKPSNKLSERVRIPERIIRLFTSLFLTGAILFAVVFILWQITSAVWKFLADLGEGNKIYDAIASVISMDIPFLTDKMPDELRERIINAVENALSSLLTALAGGITSLIGAVPQAFFLILVTIISLVYFALDYDRISRFVKSFLPESLSSAISKFRDGIFTAIKKYICSYLIILMITFATMLTGFFLLKIEHAFLLAVLVAFLDILPVIGVGTVLIPWSIVEFALGNKFLGIGLLVLFVTNAVIRQLAEPKIVGKSLDLHPIVTLLLLYVGYALFGIAGMILLPVIAVSIGVALKSNDSAEVS